MVVLAKILIIEILFAGLFGIVSIRTANNMRNMRTSNFFDKLMDISLCAAMITFTMMLWRDL